MRRRLNHKNVLPVEAGSMVFKNYAPHSSPVHFFHWRGCETGARLVDHTPVGWGGGGGAASEGDSDGGAGTMYIAGMSSSGVASKIWVGGVMFI